MTRTARRTSTRSMVLVVGAVTIVMGVFASVLRRVRRPPLEVVPRLDVDRYMGTWYEIARLPVWYERSCQDVTATYKKTHGSIQVVNRCWRRGRESSIEGRAWVPDPAEPARLTVQIRRPFTSDYQILYVDGDYHVAVVGTRNRKSAWILCREPRLDEATFQLCCDFLAEQGFDPGRLIRTPHTGDFVPARKVRPIASAEPV